MAPIQYVVEGGRRLAGTIQPAGNKNWRRRLSQPRSSPSIQSHWKNVPRIRDTETLVELDQIGRRRDHLAGPQYALQSTPGKFARLTSIPLFVRAFAHRSCSQDRCWHAAARWRRHPVVM